MLVYLAYGVSSFSLTLPQIVKDLVSACENLRALPATMGDLPTFDISSLIWDSQIHPWFPSLARGTEPGINHAT